MVVVVGVVGDALFILSIDDGDGHRADQHSVDDLGNTVKSATFREWESVDTVNGVRARKRECQLTWIGLIASAVTIIDAICTDIDCVDRI